MSGVKGTISQLGITGSMTQLGVTGSITQLGVVGSISEGGFLWNIYWETQSEVLFFAETDNIADGKLYNQKSGAIDYLAVTGAAGSYTFQCPNTAPYIAADTDYIWFRTDAFRRTVTEAELIGYDLQRTPVKYLDDSPNSIEAIMILSSAVTGSKLNRMFKDFHLSIFWNDSLNIYGRVKSNRGAGMSVWTPEVETVLWDTFTDADDTALNLHVMDVGAGWTLVNGLWKITSNRLVEPTQSGTYYAICESGKSNIDLSMDVLTPALLTSKFDAYLVFRYQNITNKWWLFFGRDPSPATFALYLNGTKKADWAPPESQSTLENLRVVASGNNIKCYFNNMLRIEVNDATYNTNTKVGIAAYRAPANLDTPRDNFICKSPYV